MNCWNFRGKNWAKRLKRCNWKWAAHIQALRNQTDNVKALPAGERQLLFTRVRAENSKGSDRLLRFFVQPGTASSNFPIQKCIYSSFPQILQSPSTSDSFLKKLAHTELWRKRQLPADHHAKALCFKTHLNSRHLVISFCRCITSYNRFWSCRW